MLLKQVRIPTVSVQESRVLAIIGQGYVGLPLAMAAVDAGWTVIGIDNFEAKVSQINAGKSPVEDISDFQLQAALASGAYKAITDFSSVAKASVITICVPTPLDEKREPDLSILQSAAIAIAPFVSNETLVVSESTSYPGTLRDIIIPIVDSLKPKETVKVYYASAPERVNPGDLIWNQKNTPRIVGAVDPESQVKALAFYKSICDAAVSVSSPEVAEAAKLLENTFRLVNIALINEFTQLCASTGINVQEVIDAAASKPYGFMPFRPGVGVGGHCIAVDPYYMIEKGRQAGFDHEFLKLARKINSNMPIYTVQLVQNSLNALGLAVKGARIGVYGLSYKANVGDTRESPSYEVVRRLKDDKLSDVKIFDPHVPQSSDFASLDEMLKNVDVLVVCTAHDEISSVDFAFYRHLALIVDGRNCLDRQLIVASGIMYRGIGIN